MMANGTPTQQPGPGNWLRQNILTPLAFGGMVGGSQNPAATVLALRRQQMMEQQFKDRMSLEKQQLGLEKQRTDMMQAEEDRKKQLTEDDQWLFANAQAFVDKDTSQLNMNELMTQLNEKRKAQHLQPLRWSQVSDFADRWLPSISKI